jgi:hypothetical protein
MLVVIALGGVIIAMINLHLGEESQKFYVYSKRMIIVILVILGFGIAINALPATSNFFYDLREISQQPERLNIESERIIYPEKQQSKSGWLISLFTGYEPSPDFSRGIIVKHRFLAYRDRAVRHREGGQTYYRYMISSNEYGDLQNPIFFWSATIPTMAKFAMQRSPNRPALEFKTWAEKLEDLGEWQQNPKSYAPKSQQSPSSQQSPAQTAPRAIQQAQVTGQTTGQNTSGEKIIVVPGDFLYKNKGDIPDVKEEGWRSFIKMELLKTGKEVGAERADGKIKLIQVIVPSGTKMAEFMPDNFAWLVKTEN